MELSSPKKLNALNKTPLGETGCLSKHLVIYGLLKHPATLSRTVRPHLVASTSLCSPCVTYMDPVLCHWSPSASHPCLGKKNFPRGGKYLNHVHPLS